MFHGPLGSSMTSPAAYIVEHGTPAFLPFAEDKRQHRGVREEWVSYCRIGLERQLGKGVRREFSAAEVGQQLLKHRVGIVCLAVGHVRDRGLCGGPMEHGFRSDLTHQHVAQNRFHGVPLLRRSTA